jgi:hypothetical protein
MMFWEVVERQRASSYVKRLSRYSRIWARRARHTMTSSVGFSLKCHARSGLMETVRYFEAERVGVFC